MAIQLNSKIEYLKGIGPVRADILKKELAIFTVGDLLLQIPFRYIDRSKFHTISTITVELGMVQLRGKISNLQTVGEGRTARLSAQLSDETGSVELIWFKGVKWVKERLRDGGHDWVILGKPTSFNGRYSLVHPELERFIDYKAGLTQGLQPVYHTSEKMKKMMLDTRQLARATATALLSVKDEFYEVLPNQLIEEFKLMPRKAAMTTIHFPKDLLELRQAQARLSFEELFFGQLRLVRQRSLRKESTPGFLFPKVGTQFNTFYKENLPFELTGAQKRVVKEIHLDCTSGQQMNRLLQGDVGSGKTLVALLAMLIAIDNGFQTTIMAPTEILAQQHLVSISKFLGGLDINIKVLTGSSKKRERKVIHEQLLNGDLDILIGTHALIEDTVQFKNLGLAIIDEQHRFGVAQRAKLWKKNSQPPHVLIMTATPIPRTLSMTFYGDLNISVIDELPPGRKPIQTFHYTDSKRGSLFRFIRKQIEEGRQIYIVYPLIQESEKLDLKDLMDGYESITREFPLPEFRVSILHGKMKPEAKAFEMDNFSKGRTQILVATTVIEVGVDVPNATVMVIENAERFGLSQLHQLRGRVGRGGEQSYCILMSSYKLSKEGKERLGAMVRTNDGFEISEVDLKLRGAGDMHGTRQSGILDLKIADIIRDEKILRIARQKAIELNESDPLLENAAHTSLKKHLAEIEKKSGNWSLIS